MSEQPDTTPTVVVADNVVVMPKPGRKRPDYTHRPKGAQIWLAAVALLTAYELYGVRFDLEHTLSRTLWWVLGPEYRPLWWLLGFPLGGLILWLWPHIMWPHWFGGRELIFFMAVMFVAGCFGVVANMGSR